MFCSVMFSLCFVIQNELYHLCYCLLSISGQKLVDLLLGKGATKQRVQEAIAVGLSRDKAENIVAYLLVDGFLKEDFHFTPYSTLSYIVPGKSLFLYFLLYFIFM